MPKDARLDLTLFGATGFTGTIAAKYICQFAPKDLKWAIAARSQSKLDALSKELFKLYPDHCLPETVVASLDEESAVKLAASAKVVVTTVGPYCRYGSGLVKACAEAGTHYVDCTGEHPWVLDMIDKHHETAKRTGAIIVPQCAFESAPADISSAQIAKTLRDNHRVETKDVTFSLHHLNGGASGGTMETFLSIIEAYPWSHLMRSSNPMALSPVARTYKSPFTLPVFRHPTLGILTPWIQGGPDRAIVLRSWGLTKQYTPTKQYGDNFTFTEFKRCKWVLEGLITWVTIAVLSIGVLLPPFRWIARKVVTQPGFGPAQETFDVKKKGALEWMSVGTSADVDAKGEKKVLCNMRFEKGDAYALTALLIVEAGLAILDLEKGEGDPECLAKVIGGGVLTPACLGEGYVKRLNEVGVTIKTRDL